MCKILIDSRSLFDQNKGGITIYTQKLIEAFLQQQDNLSYYYLQNNWRQKYQSIMALEPNKIVNYSVPSKVFNLAQLLCQRPRFDLRHCFDLVWQPSFNFISISQRCKYVLTVHDLSFLINPHWFDRQRRLWHWLQAVKKMLFRADHIVTVSENTKQDLDYFFNIKSDKITVISSGANDLVVADNNQVLRFELPAKYFFYYGTIEPRKNIVALVTAWQKLVQQDKYRDIHLVIGGSFGWGMNSFMKNYIQKNIKNLHYLNYLNDQEKKVLIQRCLALIWPTFYEGFGFPLVECLKYNIKVITSYSSAIPEITQNQVVMINPYNVNDIILAMQMVVDDKFNINKDQTVSLVAKYQWSETARQYNDLFKRLMANL